MKHTIKLIIFMGYPYAGYIGTNTYATFYEGENFSVDEFEQPKLLTKGI